MGVGTAGLLIVAVLASLWLPVCFVLYVFCERRFALQSLFIGVTLMAAAIGTLTAIHRIVY
jgi:hypothetical protein